MICAEMVLCEGTESLLPMAITAGILWLVVIISYTNRRNR